MTQSGPRRGPEHSKQGVPLADRKPISRASVRMGTPRGDRGTVWGMATAARASADVGLIGLAVMGQNLALNMADHGFRVAVYNRTTAVMEKFVAGHRNTPGGLVGGRRAARTSSPRSRRRARSSSSSRPGRRWTRSSSSSSARASSRTTSSSTAATPLDRHHPPREAATPTGCRFFGSGVSGGEEGARFGPSLMPGGDPASWEHLEPDLGGDRRQGRCQDRQAARRLGARQARHRRRALHRVHRAPTARATT